MFWITEEMMVMLAGCSCYCQEKLVSPSPPNIHEARKVPDQWNNSAGWEQAGVQEKVGMMFCLISLVHGAQRVTGMLSHLMPVFPKSCIPVLWGCSVKP